MNFLSNVANAIPGVGHAKGLVHYACGDTEGGNQAMYQATRTAAVLGGGAAGCLVGPGGAVAGAMSAGAAMDTLASIAMDKPQGIHAGLQNIGDDIKDGKFPTGSLISTAIHVGMDGIGGIGMGGVSSVASNISEKAVAKTVENVAKKVVATVGEKTLQKTVEVSGEEVVKMVTKKVTEQAVKRVIGAAVVSSEAVLVSTHVAMKAKQSEEEKIERKDREERKRREREREEREEREKRERERRDREERRRREREHEEIKEREKQERERRDRAEKDRADRERRDKEKDRADRERKDKEKDRADRERSDKEKETRSGPATGSDPPQPPEGNNNNKRSRQQQEDLFKEFIDMLTKLLNRIFGNKTTVIKTAISEIFNNLSVGQIRNFASIIERLLNCRMLEEVVTITIKIFSEYLSENISFPIFLSTLEFVATYITDELSYHIALHKMFETSSRECGATMPRMVPEVLAAKLLSELTKQEKIVEKIAVQFRTLKSDIEKEIALRPLSQNFRDIYSAVYHYYKHRAVPGDGILTVKEYFDWIRTLLGKLESPQVPAGQRYRNKLKIQKKQNVNETVVCDWYVHVYGRRVRIVVKFWQRTTVLSTCFVLDIIFEDDKEGDDVIIRYFP